MRRSKVKFYKNLIDFARKTEENKEHITDFSQRMDTYEREIHTFYAGKIRDRPVFKVSAHTRSGDCAAFVVPQQKCSRACLLSSRLDTGRLLLFQDVLTQYFEEICGESGVSLQDL